MVEDGIWIGGCVDVYGNCYQCGSLSVECLIEAPLLLGRSCKGRRDVVCATMVSLFGRNAHAHRKLARKRRDYDGESSLQRLIFMKRQEMSGPRKRVCGISFTTRIELAEW